MQKLKRLLLLVSASNWFETKYNIKRWFESTPPFSWINKARWWIRYRTWDKYHIIKTGLPPGYYDKDMILLYSSFALLVDFVEYEEAWMSYCCSDIYQQEKPWYYPAKLWVKKNGQRLGIAHLNWEASLVNEPGCQTQSSVAKEMKRLYLWWKDYLEQEDWEKDSYEKCTEMLCRLAQVRSKLWT